MWWLWSGAALTAVFSKHITESQIGIECAHGAFNTLLTLWAYWWWREWKREVQRRKRGKRGQERKAGNIIIMLLYGM